MYDCRSLNCTNTFAFSNFFLYFLSALSIFSQSLESIINIIEYTSFGFAKINHFPENRNPIPKNPKLAAYVYRNHRISREDRLYRQYRHQPNILDRIPYFARI